jgi:hypothetical protein
MTRVGYPTRRDVLQVARAACFAIAVGSAGGTHAQVLPCDPDGGARFEVLDQRGFNTYAFGVSRDGQAAVGIGSPGISGGRPVLWNAVGAAAPLPAPDSADANSNVAAYDISDVGPQGRIITGAARLPTDPFQVYLRWFDGILVDSTLPSTDRPGGLPSGGDFAHLAVDTTPDGLVYVGGSDGRAFVFDESTTTLAFLPGATSPEQSSAAAVSDDGRVVGGQVYTQSSGCPFGRLFCEPRAALWVDGVLRILPNGSSDTACVGGEPFVHDLSADGSVAVGAMNDCATAEPEAAVWRDGVLTRIPLPGAGGSVRSPAAIAVSPDGRVAVGSRDWSQGPAFVWDARNGSRDLADVLFELGFVAETEAWKFAAATDVTTTGTGAVIIVGYMWPASRTVGPGNYHGFRVTLPCTDGDRDGLCDTWEDQQYVDLNGNGGQDSGDLALTGASATELDIFVEVDKVQGTSLPDAALVDVEDAFAAVPDSLLGNPSQRTGLSLHLVLLEQDDVPRTSAWPNDGTCGVPTEFDAVKSTWFGTATERNAPNAAELLALKRRLFRYAVIGGSFVADEDGGLPEGEATPFGPDFIVAPVDPASEDEWAGLFMHELGHTLGLGHGGPLTHEQYKPNYHSVMNYTWVVPARLHVDSSLGLRRYRQSWVLDYARQPFGESLAEDLGLDESRGLGGPQGHGQHWVPVGPLEVGILPVPFPHAQPERGAIDFDRDDVLNEPFSAPVNVNDVTHLDPQPPDEFLEANDDWSFVASEYCSFFEHPNWQGGRSCAGWDALAVREPSFEDRVSLSIDIPMDCNGNGVSDDEDLTQGTSVDADDDALLDECEPLAGDCDDDADVDEDDRNLFISSFGRAEGEPEYLECADLDADRIVTFVDYQAWIAAREAAQAAAAAESPTPVCGSTGSTEATALLGVLWVGRRVSRRSRRRK